MKVGTIIKPNSKGQIVIPKDFRKDLGIDSGISLNVVKRGYGIFIYPITEVLSEFEDESSYKKILEKTKGKWKDEKWDELTNKRRKLELAATKRRKEAW